ncbi:MAG TPA: phage major capsid protein [Verrucomicrobiae bacterium]|nr:phage major capsid protein [Verrucomicrobiae bacterium]
MLRREIHPVVRVLDEKQGLVQYVASDESLDSYREIIKADGWRFDNFEKNAPVVDSHDYSSLGSLLGSVVDFGLKGRQLLETIKWAIDVPENALAQLGFKMTIAGYLKAVSVGFLPVRTATPYDNDKDAWREACEQVRIDSNETDCRCIYLEQQQIELSVCVVGANPNALARSYADGILTDALANRISTRFPDFASRLEQAIRPARRSYSFSSTKKSADPVGDMIKVLGGNTQTSRPKTSSEPMKTEHTIDFSQLTGDSKRAFENMESARHTGTETEIERAVLAAFAKLKREERHAYGNPIQRYLDDKPEMRFLWNGIARKLCGHGVRTSLESHAISKAVSGFNLQDTFGVGLLQTYPIADDIYNLLLQYGQYKDLGLRKMVGQYTKYTKVTGFPTAIFITPNQLGKATIPPDNSLAGTSLTPDANTIAALIQISLAWLEDEKVDLSEIVLEKFIMGLASRIDYGCFQGNGQDDTMNGMTTGLFFDGTIPKYQAGAGAIQVAGLQRTDFINVTGQVAPAALQRMEVRSPRWYISPVLIPQLLQLRDGAGPKYLLKTPAETGGPWRLVGFPVTWAAQAPATNAANAKVAVFGNPDAYLVALHKNFELSWSAKGQEFGSATSQFRALGRGQSMMREVTGFAALQLAAG